MVLKWRVVYIWIKFLFNLKFQRDYSVILFDPRLEARNLATTLSFRKFINIYDTELVIL
jgi:hypothetical protein